MCMFGVATLIPSPPLPPCPSFLLLLLSCPSLPLQYLGAERALSVGVWGYFVHSGALWQQIGCYRMHKDALFTFVNKNHATVL